MSYSSISKIENELAFPTIEQINLYQEYFKVSLDYLVGLTENTSVELNKITNYTGLSQSAIERLHHYLEQANSSISSSENDDMILCDNSSALKTHWITELYNDLICDEAFAELLKELYDLKRTTKLLTDTLGIIDDFSSIVEGSLRGLIIKSQIIDVDLASKINELKEKCDIRKSELYRQRLESIINSLESKTGISEYLKIGEIAVNPCLNCTLPKYEAPDHKILSVADTQRFLQLLDENADLKYRAFFNIAIYGGFRRGEILALTWDDIDFDNNMVHIKRAVHWSTDRGYYYTDPKTKKSKRSVKMTDRVMFILKQMKNEQLSAKLKYGDYWNNPQRLVFTADDGSTMSMGTPYKFLKRFCEEYALPRVSVHSMSHLNATLLISKGTNVKATPHI